MIFRAERRGRRLLADNYTRILAKLNFPGIEYEEQRLASIHNSDEKLLRLEALARQQPERPEWWRRLAHQALIECREDWWVMLDKYHQVRERWLEDTGLANLNLEFVSRGMILGSLGQFQMLEFLLKANQLGLRKDAQLVTLLPSTMVPHNPALFSYISKNLNIIENTEAIKLLEPLSKILELPLELALPMKNGCPHEEIAGNLVEQLWAKEKRKSWIVLSDDHRERGMTALKELGVPCDAWYVTLHARQAGYRDRGSQGEDYRNVEIATYEMAIKEITREGGWVIRMGDSSMPPLREMSQVVDYANHPLRCDWLDVFFGATCKFCVATSSGYYVIPRAFGVPVLLTNFLPMMCYYSLSERDVVLPKRLRRVNGGYLTCEEQLDPTISYAVNSQSYVNLGLEVVGNTSNELAHAVRSMLNRLNSNSTPCKTQPNLRNLIERTGRYMGGFDVKAQGSFADAFTWEVQEE